MSEATKTHETLGPPRRRRQMPPRLRRQLLGASGLAMVVVIIAGVIMLYNQVFSPSVSATVLAPRAGLLMDNGADVTLNGVTVGQVTSISPVGDNGARLGIRIDPRQVSYIPANVQAAINAPTVFGPKYLSLSDPAHPVAQRLQNGAVIEPAQVSTEIDTVFSNLVSVLNTVHPAKLSATLGAISTALNGRGAKLGNFIVQLNSYLHQFNPSLPAIGRDFALAPSVANAYASAAPDLISTLDNLRVTSGTLVSQQAQFDAFLVDLTGFAGQAQTFLSSNETSLTRTLATLLPTTQLLDYYSPEISCTFANVEQINTMSHSDKILLNTAIVPGNNQYKNPANLPVVAAKNGPNCYGAPMTKASAAHWGRVNFNDGTNGSGAGGSGLTLGNPPLAVQLFGPSNASAASAAAAKKGH